MEHIQQLLSQAGQNVHKTLDVSDETVRRLHDRVLRALPKQEQASKKWIAAAAAVTVAAAAIVVLPQVLDNMQTHDQSGNGGGETGPNSTTAIQDPNPKIVTDASKATVPDSVIQRMPDNAKLTLTNPIPFGRSYQQIKQFVPELGQQMPQGGLDSLAEQGLTEAYIPITVFGKEIQLQFAFRNNHMYSILYHLPPAEPQAVAELEQQLLSFYNDRVTQTTTEKQRDGATTAISNYWDMTTYTISITNSLNYDGKANLNWGFALKESEQEKLGMQIPQSD